MGTCYKINIIKIATRYQACNLLEIFQFLIKLLTGMETCQLVEIK